MTVHCTANRGRNGNRLITITEKTVSASVEIILFRKNLKDEVKLKKIWIDRQNTYKAKFCECF